MKYELIEILDVYTNEVTAKGIKATSENGEVCWIPFDPANSDYAEYLAQLEATPNETPESTV
jgi:hypothetical protein